MDDHFPLVELTSLIGEEHSQYFPTLIHLVIADSAYLELNLQNVEHTNGTTIFVSLFIKNICSGSGSMLPMATSSLEIES